MFSRFLIAVAAAAVVLGGSVCAKAAEVLIPPYRELRENYAKTA